MKIMIGQQGLMRPTQAQPTPTIQAKPCKNTNENDMVPDMDIPRNGAGGGVEFGKIEVRGYSRKLISFDLYLKAELNGHFGSFS